MHEAHEKLTYNIQTVLKCAFNNFINNLLKGVWLFWIFGDSAETGYVCDNHSNLIKVHCYKLTQIFFLLLKSIRKRKKCMT